MTNQHNSRTYKNGIRTRSKTKLLIVGKSDPAALSVAMQEWLLPVLVDRFLAEHRLQVPAHRNENDAMRVCRNSSVE